MKLYPLKFQPILKELIWGGNKICKFKGITPEKNNVGESWEISGVKGNVSIVSNGKLKGKRLDELLVEYKKDLVGQYNFERFGTVFPLLIKFIDTNADVSIQVHPNDELAKKRHNSFGKTEMWYIINASPGASVLMGFSKQMTPKKYNKAIEERNFVSYLREYNIQSGDVFLVPTGRVHAAKAGAFFIEIQQTSDITYRIFDYDRLGADGKKRELHTELAKDAIDYTVLDNYRTEYPREENKPVVLESTRYFTTQLLKLTKNKLRDFSKIDSFVIYVCFEGTCHITDECNNAVEVKQGESILIPASTQTVHIEPDKKVLLLETYVLKQTE
jgi:mannose-6-phosphate isomerase